MRKLLPLVALLGLLLTLGLLASACAQDQSCASVMSHFYDVNCTLTSGGTPISEEAAVTWCEDARTAASAVGCNCQAALQDVLDCLDASGENECDNCSTQFDASNACFGACG
jgi:hypothetical protein